MKELILLMPPHATPLDISSVEAATRARAELAAEERHFVAMHRARPEHDEALSQLREEIAKADRYIEEAS
jgi:hypothetical protein